MAVAELWDEMKLQWWQLGWQQQRTGRLSCDLEDECQAVQIPLAKSNLLRLLLLRQLGQVFLLWEFLVREKIVASENLRQGGHREVGSVSYVCCQRRNCLRAVNVLGQRELRCCWQIWHRLQRFGRSGVELGWRNGGSRRLSRCYLIRFEERLRWLSLQLEARLQLM